MNTCAHCQHWDPTRTGWARQGRRCDRLEDSGQLFADAWEKAGIFTAPDFGCNLFEPSSAARTDDPTQAHTTALPTQEEGQDGPRVAQQQGS